MNDNEFWIQVWKVVAGCFCVLVLTSGGCVMRGNQLLANSSDPIALACANGDSSRVSQACTVVMTRNAK